MKVVDLFRDRVQFCVSGSKTEKDGRGCWVVLSVVLELMCLCVVCLVYCLSEHRSYRWKATANLLVPTMLGRGKNFTSGGTARWVAVGLGNKVICWLGRCVAE